MWNIILSSLYKHPNKIYYVRDTFFHTFGRSLKWWLTLILIIFSAMIFELGTMSLRAAFFTTDEDVFQALEKDPAVKRRFEEAASNELQQGWDRTTNKQRDAEEKIRAVVDALEKKEEERREGEVKELLRKRVENGDEQGHGVNGDVHGDASDGTNGQTRKRAGSSSTGVDRAGVDSDPHSLLERGFGRVKRDETGRNMSLGDAQGDGR